MEKRIGKINISEAGGTAAEGAKTYKLTLPTTWLEAMGIDKERRDVVLGFDGRQITVSRRLSAAEFAEEKRALCHNLLRLRFYDGDRLCTTIYADFSDESIAVENHTEDVIKTAFGNDPFPDWNDFQSFLRERCIPSSRAGLREYLDALGLEEYDPLNIILKTKGKMAEDEQWLETEAIK